MEAEDLRALRRKARLATLTALEQLGGEATRGDIIDRALARAGFTKAELAEPAPEKSSSTRRVDHELSWTLTRLKKDGLVVNPRWSVWALAGAAREPERTIASPVATDRLSRLQAMPYRDYLRTPEWRETRAAALIRAGSACALDATHLDELEVHHRSYDRLGEERPSDLTVLCNDCHALHHKANGRPRRRPLQPSVGPPALQGAAGAAPRPRTGFLTGLLGWVSRARARAYPTTARRS